jgi:hypothetical protein
MVRLCGEPGCHAGGACSCRYCDPLNIACGYARWGVLLRMASGTTLQGAVTAVTGSAPYLGSSAAQQRQQRLQGLAHVQVRNTRHGHGAAMVQAPQQLRGGTYMSAASTEGGVHAPSAGVSSQNI